MKKFIGAICSIASAGLLFLFLSLSNLVSTTIATNVTTSMTGWDILQLNTETNGLLLYKIFAIVAIVLAVLLIISALLLLLQNFGLLKVKINFNLINNALLFVFMASAVVMLVAGILMAGAMSANLGGYVGNNTVVGLGIYLNLGVSIAAFVLALLFAKKVKQAKSRKRK